MESSHIGCGALVYSKATHRYLFLLRNQKRHAGSWGLVGGGVELNESPPQALQRDEFIPKLNNEHRGYAWTSIEDHPKPLHPGVWRTFNFKSIVNKIKTVETVIHQPLAQIVQN